MTRWQPASRRASSASPPSVEPEPDLSASRPAALPDFVQPMIATLTEGAFDDPDWLYEIKWDGYRVEAVVDPQGGSDLDAQPHRRFHLLSRSGRSHRLDRGARGGGGWRGGGVRPRGPSRLFSLLQDRTGLRGLEAATGRRSPDGPRLTAEERKAIPLAYMVFDLLHLDGRSLLDVPLEDRKRLLRRVMRPDPLVRYAAHVVGEGEDFARAAAERGLEGVVAKRRAEPLRARQAIAGLAEDQAAPRAGDGRRRVAAGQGEPRRPRIADRGRERRWPACGMPGRWAAASPPRMRKRAAGRHGADAPRRLATGSRCRGCRRRAGSSRAS